MNKQIREYIKIIENKKLNTEDINDLLTRISFYQHERQIHLIVTMFTGLYTIIMFLGMLTLNSIIIDIIFIILMLLFIPYIFHYYFLENNVQKLYDIYIKNSSLK